MQDGAIRIMGSGCNATWTGEGSQRRRGGSHQVEEGKTHCRMCGDEVAEAAGAKIMTESGVTMLYTDVAGKSLLTNNGAFVPISAIRDEKELNYYVDGLLARSTGIKEALEWAVKHEACVVPVNCTLVRALVKSGALSK